MILNTNIAHVARRIQRRQSFRIKLPHDNRIYLPDYKQPIFIEGDIIVFHTAQTIEDIFHVGIIQKTFRKSHLNHYNVDCIKRLKIRDPRGVINWLPRAEIKQSHILCELTPERKYK